MVTADIAFSYNREVFAFPGRGNDLYSAGCNDLIRKNKAGLITSADDLIDALGWRNQAFQEPKQVELHFDDSPEVQQILTLLQEHKELHVNQLSKAMHIPLQQLSLILFDLEMNGRIKTLPGNMYALIL